MEEGVSKTRVYCAIYPRVTDWGVAGAAEPFLYRGLGAGRAFSLMVVLQVTGNDAVIHFSRIRDDLGSSVSILDVHLCEGAEGSRAKIASEGLESPFGALLLDDHVDGLLDRDVLSDGCRSGAGLEEGFAVGVGILSDVFQGGFGFLE